MVYSKIIKQKANLLRKEGLLFAQIASELGITKSTAYEWTKDLLLTDDQKIKINASARASQLEKVRHLADLNRVRREAKDLEITDNAKGIVDSIILDLNGRTLLCSVMFWCEGGKDISGGIQFINSDPVMMATFLSLLRSSFPIDESRFRALIHLHDYHDPQTQLQFWSKVTGIPPEQFHKPFVKPHTGKNKRVGYPGCLSVRYLDRSLGKTLQMIYTEFGLKYRGVR